MSFKQLVKRKSISLLALFFSLIYVAQTYHYKKGLRCLDINWDDWAFSEWQTGANKGEVRSAMALSFCYLNEWGTQQNLPKCAEIIDSWASKDKDALVIAANYWFPSMEYSHAELNYAAGGKFRYWGTLYSWQWDKSDIITPNCTSENLLYGNKNYEVGRQEMLSHKQVIDELQMLVTTYENNSCKESIYKSLAEQVGYKISDGVSLSDEIKKLFNGVEENYFTIQETIANLNEIKEFIDILEKEDDGTVEISDYKSYMAKYTNAYYRQYCVDAIARLIADTYTLETPKDKIEALLKTELSKGTKKYIKDVTKKSYLQSKEL